jgi:molybdate transport system ATP-binding protein
MNRHKHTAIDGTNLSMSSPIIKNILRGECVDYLPELAGKTGKLFSNTTLNKFIEEEANHDDCSLTKETNRSIRSFSSGEKKKALLSYLLSKNPDFLIVDNPFDALDVESVALMKKKLEELSEKMTIIQVFKRKKDLLPFISHAIRVEGDKVIYADGIKNYLKIYFPDEVFQFEGKIPPPLSDYEVNTDELISFTHVNVKYGDQSILKNINWSVKAGEFWQLVGPNGAGKSTILSMINGDNPKAYGEDVKLFGKKKGTGESVWKIKEKIGYFTSSMMDLYKHRHTAQQMVVSGLTDSIGLYKKVGKVALNLADDWLRMLGIFDDKNKPFVSFSQVKRRMILMARAMIKHPPLLILDEPSTGLDDKSASMLSALINKMANEGNTAILYVSHRMEPGLEPEYIYQLTPTENGSVGKVL